MKINKIFIPIFICLCLIAYVIGYASTTTTTNLSLVKPGSEDTTVNFFDTVNDNMDLIDAIFDTVTLTEFGYLDGVTSAIQDQFDAIGAGAVDTSGTPVANDIARFTDADTIEGLSYAEFKAALDLEIGTDIQALLSNEAGLYAALSDVSDFVQGAEANSIDSAMYVDGSIDHEHLAPDVISGLADVTSTDSDYMIIVDQSDSWALKKVDMGEVRGAGGGTVDTSGTPVDDDFAKFTDANTIEGRSYSETRTDLGLVIGTNVLAEQTIGIADNNLLEVDDADAADDDFAKFTANGLEGRSYAETMKDLNPITTSSANNTLTVDEAGLVLVSDAHTETLPTAVGNAGLTYSFVKTDWDYDLITLEGHVAETFNYENSTGSPNLTYLRLNTPGAGVTIVSDNANWQVIDEAMGQVPYMRAYLTTNQLNIKTNDRVKIILDAEDADIGSNFDISNWVTGTADGTVANHLQDDGNSQFTSAMEGCLVKNTTDSTETYITMYNDAGDVTVRDNIFTNGESYEIPQSRFTAPVAGTYRINGNIGYDAVVVDKRYFVMVQKNNASIFQVAYHSSNTSVIYGCATDTVILAKDDYIDLWAYTDAGTETVDIVTNAEKALTFLSIILVSKD